MAIYRIQRLYSDDEKSGMGTLSKVALTTAAIGGGLMAGKAGMLGTTVQRGIGTSTAWLGNKVGSQAMVKSGARTVGKSARTDAIKAAGGEEAVKNMGFAEKRAIAGKANDASRGIMDTYGLPAKEAAFSEDTERSLREAKLIGGGLALTTGGVLLAKHGKLGPKGTKAYDKVVGKVKKVWAETKKDIGGKPKTEVVTEEAIITPENKEVISRKRYPADVYKKIREYLMKKGIKHPKTPDIEEAASALGIK